MMSKNKTTQLRSVITDNLRVQRDGKPIQYIDSGNAVADACSRQNHVVFARRGCGKTLLLHSSTKSYPSGLRAVYLNCEDFKRHTFPNVLIEILNAIFREFDRNILGWFGKGKKAKNIVKNIQLKLAALLKTADTINEEIRQKTASQGSSSLDASAGVDIDKFKLKIGGKIDSSEKEEIERSFKIHREKLQELDEWLPRLKQDIRDIFSLSKKTTSIIIQIDDLYHLKRTDQAFVVDYIHKLCKDVPLYFKIATLRHASTLFVEQGGQPIGAQERHDYQPIDIDYTFGNFKRTAEQNWAILKSFAREVKVDEQELESLFKGQGFDRLVMAGGGVPRDVLSLFLTALSNVDPGHGGQIGKDEVRIMSLANFERRIEELKQDSKIDEQDDLLRGIYAIREFCLSKQTNVLVVEEKTLKQNSSWRALFNRLMDYRIINNCATALTHKSQPGTYQAFAIDIGCYAHLRKLQGKFTEIDVTDSNAKDRMRSAPIFDIGQLEQTFRAMPADVESAILAPEE